MKFERRNCFLIDKNDKVNKIKKQNKQYILINNSVPQENILLKNIFLSCSLFQGN